MSRLFLAHMDWAELQRVRQGRGGIKHLVDRAGGHCAFRLTPTGRVSVQNPGAPTLGEQPPEWLESKRPGLRLIWIAFCCVVLTKLLNNRKCPQQYCHPSVHRLNVAFCLCACYGEKYFTSSSKCRRLQLKAKRSLPSNSNYEHEKSHYVYLQALI